MISQDCATSFSISGPLRNTAYVYYQSVIFAIPMTIAGLLSLLSTARLVYLSNSVVRIQRISFVSMLL